MGVVTPPAMIPSSQNLEHANRILTQAYQYRRILSDVDQVSAVDVDYFLYISLPVICYFLCGLFPVWCTSCRNCFLCNVRTSLQIALDQTIAGIYDGIGFRRKAAMFTHFAGLDAFRVGKQTPNKGDYFRQVGGAKGINEWWCQVCVCVCVCVHSIAMYGTSLLPVSLSTDYVLQSHDLLWKSLNGYQHCLQPHMKGGVCVCYLCVSVYLTPPFT